MSVVDYPQVKNSQQAEVIRAAGLLTVITGQLHILSIIDNEGIPSPSDPSLRLHLALLVPHLLDRGLSVP